MNTYFATFGDLLIGYHLVLRAKNADIAHAWMMKQSKLGCFCRICDYEPGTKPLTEKPIELFYHDAAHV